MLVVPVFLKRRPRLGVILDARYWMLEVPVFLKRRSRLGRMLDTGYWMLDAGSAGVLEKTVSAWKDAGYGSEYRCS
jgi:hypothetical protein